MKISSTLFIRGIAVVLLALALNMAAAAFMGGNVVEATNVMYGPQATDTVTLPPFPSATPTRPPATQPPQATVTPPPLSTATPTATKIIVLPPTGLPDGGTGANLALVAGALATAGAGLLLASRRTNR